MIRLRPAKPEDVPALVEIYRPYVEIGTASLEYDTPSVEEFGRRLESISAEFPYIVCEVDGEVVGYSYAHRYKEGFGKKRLGTRLYSAVIELLGLMGYRNLYGIVTDPNPGSFALHKSLGFSETGREHLAGVKFGEWHDVVLFEKLIAPHEPLTDDPHRMPLTVSGIGQDKFAEILAEYGK